MAPPLLFAILLSTLAASSNTRSSSSSSSINNKSPWSSAEWRIYLNFGREAGTYMPEEWGASGARLVLPVEVLVESERYPNREAEKDFMGGSGASDVLSVLEDATYIAKEKGQQRVRFGNRGAWKIASRRTGERGDASTIRFWLDILDAAGKNDVSIGGGGDSDASGEGERLYATASCWREEELQFGQRRLAPILARYETAQQAVDDRLAHGTGDRRLDGTDIVDTALASIDMAVLIQRRDEFLRDLREAERKLPCNSNTNNNNNISSPSRNRLSQAGDWPGSSEKLVFAEGKIGVKRKKGLLWEELHIVGTWTATPLETLSSDQYYEEEEEDASSEDSNII